MICGAVAAGKKARRRKLVSERGAETVDACAGGLCSRPSDYASARTPREKGDPGIAVFSCVWAESF